MEGDRVCLRIFDHGKQTAVVCGKGKFMGVDVNGGELRKQGIHRVLKGKIPVRIQLPQLVQRAGNVFIVKTNMRESSSSAMRNGMG